MAAPPAVAAPPLAAAFKAAAAERDARRMRLDKAVEATLLVADDLENNCRAALGLQLQAAVSNVGRLEASIRALRGQVAGLGRTCAGHAAAYDALAAAAAEAGPVDAYVRNTDAALARIVDNLEFVAGRLTSDE